MNQTKLLTNGITCMYKQSCFNGKKLLFPLLMNNIDLTVYFGFAVVEGRGVALELVVFLP